MTTALVHQSRQLIIPESLSFEDQSLEWQSRKLTQESKETEAQLTGLQGKLNMVASFMAFRNRNLVASVEQLKWEYHRLLGQEYEKYVPVDPDDLMKQVYAPKPVHEKKRADRFVEAEIKDLFRRIGSKCHPDKTLDKNLHEFMPFANDLYEAKELELLRQVWQAVNDYVTAKKKRNVKDFFKARINGIKQILAQLRERLEQAKQTKQYEMVVCYEQRDYDHASRIYCNILEEQMMDLRVQIAQLKASRRVADGFGNYRVTPMSVPEGWFRSNG